MIWTVEQLVAKIPLGKSLSGGWLFRWPELRRASRPGQWELEGKRAELGEAQFWDWIWEERDKAQGAIRIKASQSWPQQFKQYMGEQEEQAPVQLSMFIGRNPG